MNTIFECLYMFFGGEKVYQLSTYETGGGMDGHPKCMQLRTGGEAVTPHVYVHTYTISFHVFDSIFVL